MKSSAAFFAITALLSALFLFPYIFLSRPKDSTSIAQCANNMRQISEALKLYGADKGAYPATLQDLLRAAYVRDSSAFTCAHKSSVERQAIRQLRAGILAVAAGLMAVILRNFLRRRTLAIPIGAAIAIAFFIPGDLRAIDLNTVDYVYAPPTARGLQPRLQDKTGNHGAHAINVLARDGSITTVGPTVPKAP
jgi:hypothetical protein